MESWWRGQQVKRDGYRERKRERGGGRERRRPRLRGKQTTDISETGERQGERGS